MSDLKIIYKNIEELTPYDNNPRLNDSGVDALAESIKQFGFKVPVIIDKNGVVVAGHTRIKACKKLGIKDVPCIIADDLTDEQIKAFRLADNKVAELSGWDFEKLENELAEIDFDMTFLGFGDVSDEALDLSFIDALSDDDLSQTNGESEWFTISFTFPAEKRELVEDYISKIGKEEIVNNLIEKAEEEENA